MSIFKRTGVRQRQLLLFLLLLKTGGGGDDDIHMQHSKVAPWREHFLSVES